MKDKKYTSEEIIKIVTDYCADLNASTSKSGKRKLTTGDYQALGRLQLAINDHERKQNVK